jgi:flagellar basal-body rod modification protein FlgD
MNVNAEHGVQEETMAIVEVKTEITGKVDGIDFSTTVPTLLIGAIKVSLDKVKSVKATS